MSFFPNQYHHCRSWLLTLVLPFVVPGLLSDCKANDPGQLNQFLNQYCVSCHGPEEDKGGIDLSQLNQQPPAESRYLMELVHEQLQDDLMPPAKAPQPDPIKRETLVKWLEEQLALLDGFLPNDPGVVVMPRLTRTEFENVMRDLTGVEMDLKSRLPPDYSAGEGFLNVGEAQSTTDAVIEKYLAATRHALSHVRISPVTGLVWHPLSLPEIHDLAGQRRDLMEAWVNLHVAAFERQVHTISEHLKTEAGMVAGAYLHAAWRYQHRDALDKANWSLTDFAEQFEPAISGAVLEGWWAFLSDPASDSQLLETLKQGWRELPEPHQISEAQLKQRLMQLDEFAGAYHRLFRKFQQESRTTSIEQEVRYGEEGRSAEFVIDCSETSILHLVTTPHLTEHEGNAAEWTGGTLFLSDGRELDWKESATITDLSGQPAARAVTQDSNTIRVPAPSVIRVVLPDGTDRFDITGVAMAGEDVAGVQMYVSEEAPTPQQLVIIPGRMALFGGGKESASYQNYKKAVEELGGLTFRPRNFPALAAFRGFDKRYESYLDFSIYKKTERTETADFSEEEKRIDRLRPFTLTAGALRDHMNADERQEMLSVKKRFLHESGIPHSKLYRYLKKQGMNEEEEGAWPNPRQQKALMRDAAGRDLWADVQQEEGKLAEQARELILTFAERAWSFEPKAEQLAVLMQLYHQAKRQGFPFDAAVKRPMQAVLLAPYFLYRLPPADMVSQDAVRDLTGEEFARRLSFFLWSSIPDEELLEKARSGALFNEDELRAQIARMLSDERSQSLIKDFAGVWLGFSNFPEDADPDRELFPTFDKELQQAMQQETELFFTYLFQENRPLLEMLSADYTFLNERLADHYDIKGVEGKEFRRVATKGYPRGGVLTQGSLLTLKSKRLRTSPIMRGEWILTSVLGVPIPEPPNVPPISEEEVNEEGLTIIEQLQAHRDSPACQSCHDRIDPPGIVLESFDPIGRWREHYQNGERIQTGATFQNAKGTTILKSIEDLKQHLTHAEAERFSHQTTRKMLAYALGRSLIASDHGRIDTIVKALEQHDYHLQELIYQIVTSPQFRLRREHPPQPFQAANPQPHPQP